MFRLNKINYSNGGRTISYDYDTDSSIAKYFNKKESFYLTYGEDVSSLPESVNVIPLLANIMPIAWFAGFDVHVDSLDETFYQSLENLRKEFKIHFPKISPEVKLHVGELVPNLISGENTALLFSGGLDAFESLTRNIDKNPFLVSVVGADIDVGDKSRWEDFKRFNEEEPIIRKDRICYVESNLQTFYTYEVDLLVNIGWWGKIQHGMALISLIAPLSFLKNIKTVLIASSNTGEVSFGWGSTSETDEQVKWADMKVIHDGFHLRRTEKIGNIITFAKKTGDYIKLRVCYNEFRIGYNCSRCAKCQRTMFGFILSGESPNNYGFEVPTDFYELLFKNFENGKSMTTGVAYEWRCLQEKALDSANPHVLREMDVERKNIGIFAHLNLEKLIDTNADRKDTSKTIKFLIIKRFPRLFSFYLNIRRKF